MVRKMKDSGIEWIGDIPEHWEVPKLKHVTKNYYSGGTPSAANEAFYSENGSYFANIIDITNHNELTSTVKRITESGVKDKNLKIVPKESFLYAMYASVGKFSISKTDMYISQAILSFKEKNIKKGYLSLYFVFIGGYVDYFSFGTTQINLNAEIVKNLPILFPSSEEQEAIVNFLDKKTSQIDHIIEKSKESIEKYKRYKESLITETVTKGLVKNVPMKDSGIEWIGQIPEHWETLKMKYCVKANARTLTEKTNSDYEFRYIDIGSVDYQDGIIRYEEMKFRDAPSRARRIVSKGDVIISTVRTYLKAIAVIEDDLDVIVSTGFAVLNALSINSVYLSYVTKSYFFISEIIKQSVGVSYPAINTKELLEIKIPFPPINEQEAIANFLDKKTSQIDKIISEKGRLIEKLETYKKSLIFEYVTGKKEVM